MTNFTESFNEFSNRLSTMDLALYAGVGLVLWVVFKERLSPVQQLIMSLVDNVKSLLSKAKTDTESKDSVVPVVSKDGKDDDIFFKLVVSWKQTRDLAEKSGCPEAVKVADQMFPFLSPNVCGKENS